MQSPDAMSDEAATDGEAAAELSDVIAWAGATPPESVQRKAQLLRLDSLGLRSGAAGSGGAHHGLLLAMDHRPSG